MPAQVMDGTSVAEFLIGVTASGAAASRHELGASRDWPRS